jgi:hypothetical protein
MRGVQVRAINSVVENQESERASSYTGGGRNFLRQSCLAKTKTRHSLYSHGKNRHFGDSDCPASDAGRGEDMGAGVGADRGTGSAARARTVCRAVIARASALALNGMAAFTDIGMITRRRAGWPVRRVSMRSRITRQSPAYAPCDAFADVSAAAPAIASADTARRIRFITASFFFTQSVNAHRREGVLVILMERFEEVCVRFVLAR